MSTVEENSLSSEEDWDKTSQEEDWDKDLGLEDAPSGPPFKLNLPLEKLPSKLLDRRSSLFPENDDLEDWSKDFESDNSEQTPKTPFVVTGISADPNATEEDWDKDFDFGDGADKGDDATHSLRLNRVNSSTRLKRNSVRLSFNLKEILNSFPDTKPTKTTHRKTKRGTEGNEEPNGKAIAIWELGLICFQQENFVDAMKHFQKSQYLLNGVDAAKRDSEFEAELVYYLGTTARSLGKIVEAGNFLRQASEYFVGLKVNNPSLKAAVNYQLGLCSIATENYNMALHQLADSLKEHFQAHPSEMEWSEICKACLNIGKCCKRVQLQESAREYFKRAVEIASQIGDDATKADAKLGLRSVQEPESEVEISGTEEENWDDEFGLEDSQRTTLRLPGSNSALAKVSSMVVDSESLLSPKYKLLEATRQDVEIVKFPKATMFYSTTTEYRLVAEDFQQWINTIITKHTDVKRHKVKDIKKTDLELKQDFVTGLQSIEKYSLDWARHHFDICYTLAHRNSYETTWAILFECFLDLKDCDRNAHEEPEIFSHIMLQLVYLAAKIWKSEEDKSFQEILNAVKTFDPQLSDLVILIKTETYAHHKYQDLDKDALGYIETFAKIYKKNNADNSSPKAIPCSVDDQTFVQKGPYELQARALCNIHFLLTDISPLTMLHRDLEEDEDDDQERKGWTGTEMNLRFDYVSDLVDASTRYDNLLKLYTSLKISHLKAKAAYVLGHHAAFGLEDTRLAEQFFFECLWVLDSLKPQIPGQAPAVSELGANALSKYADMLLANGKYIYAVACYSSAISNYKTREKPNYLSLLRRLANITKDNDDYRVSIDYFKEVLDKYVQELKENEVRFVSETLSGLYISLGEYRKAQAFLERAIKIVQPPHPASEKIDPITFRLQMKEADLLLESYHFELGIELLEDLNNNRQFLPHGARPAVLTKLAKAYIKKRWFKECASILQRLEKELDDDSPDFSVSPAGPRSPPGADKKKMKFWELSCLNYYHSCQYPEALCCVEMALSICPSNSLSSLGRFYYLRGKIFQALCSTSSSLQFPTTLKPENGLKQTTQTKYTCTGDLIQECIWSYDKAYSYFRVMGDDLHIAKTVNNISATYLDRVFGPVALLHVPFNDLARFPFFSHSKREKDETIHKSPRPRRHMRSKSENAAPERKELFFEITFERIENPAMCALDIGADMCHIWMMSVSYLNMAELRFLTGDIESALSFWVECKEQLMTLFMDHTILLAKGAPPRFLRKLYVRFERLVRLLFCFDSDIINQNLSVIDAYTLLQFDVEQSQRRPLQPLTKETKSEESGESKSKSNSFGRGQKYPLTYPTGNVTNKTPSNRANVSTIFSDTSPRGSATTSPLKEERRSNPPSDEEIEKQKKIDEIRAETSERIWGFLASIKTQVLNYVKGKISQEEVYNKNRKILKKILSVKRANEMMKQNVLVGNPLDSGRSRSHSGTPRSSPEPSFQERQAEFKELKRLTYILQLGEYIIYYVPSSGQKRVQQLGGKEESMNAASLAPQQQLHLHLHFMADTDEYVSLLVAPSITLDKVLKFLCNKAYWESDDKKKSSFWGSIGRNQNNPSGLKNKPKFVERSKDFHNRLISLLNLLGLGIPSADKGEKLKQLTSSQLSLIAFAKKSVNDFTSSSAFSALTVSTQTTVAQCFSQAEMKQSSAENPLTLFLYLSTNTDSSELESSSSALQKDFSNKTILFSTEIVGYLSSLVAKDAQEDTETCKKIVMEMVDSVFTPLMDIVPYADKSELFETGDGKTVKVPSNPLSIICSGALHLFPWELMLGESAARYLSLQDMIDHLHYLRSRKSLTDLTPKYFSCFISTADRSYLNVEERRRDWLLREFLFQLNVFPRLSSCMRFSNIVPPFHTPLIKTGKRVTAYKRQYKAINWLDFGLMDSVWDLWEVVESSKISETTHSQPIFLFTYSDMLECTEPLLLLMRCFPNCTFLFVPASKSKQIISKLMKANEEYLKSKTKQISIYQFLMSSIATIQSETGVPITIFNSPRDVI